MADQDPTAERWLPIEGFGGRYAVSSYGRVRSSWGGGRILSPKADRNGYLSVNLYHNGACKTLRVHRLVLAAFVRPAKPGEQTNHLNFDTSDNRCENLEWCTPQQNSDHIGEHSRKRGRGRLTADQVTEVRRRAQIGESLTSIARSFGTVQQNVSSIVRRATWKHVT